jgi:hypothetical protein
MRPAKNSWVLRNVWAMGERTSSSIRRFHISTMARSVAPVPKSGGSGCVSSK